MPNRRIWYLVMNASRLRILRGLPGAGSAAVAEVTLQSGRQALRAYLRERAGSGGALARVNGRTVDLVREDTIRFLEEIADFLVTQRRGDGFWALVLVAPPEVIELWHHVMPEAVLEAVRCEVARNLVRLPAPELGQAIRSQMEAQGVRFQAGHPISWTKVR